jgi:hypothetical protein
VTTEAEQIPTRHSSYDPGYGWVLFAAVLLMLLATVDLIEGLAAVGGSAFFVRNAHYVMGSLDAWGWIVTVLGTFEFIAAFGILVKNPLARWAGVVLLGLDIIVQLLLMQADPFWSLAIIGVDVLAIYALVVHGGTMTAAQP